MSEVKIQKPFLKWVGGKTQMIEKINAYIPNNIQDYHEIFLGGGSVLFLILSLLEQKTISITGTINAYDLNKALINTYEKIKTDCESLLIELKKLKDEFTTIAENTKKQRGAPKIINEESKNETREHYYYFIRDKFNEADKDSTLAAAYFIFLNKTGFRGMYREGPAGLNIPYGLKDTKKIPSIYDENEIRKISKMIKNVNFKCLSYKESVPEINHTNDYVYLDPPYAPENSKSFVGYNEEGFTIDNHKELFKMIQELNSKKIKFLLSNAKVDLVTEHFQSEQYEIVDIEARRAINSKNPGAKTTEVLISNSFN